MITNPLLKYKTSINFQENTSLPSENLEEPDFSFYQPEYKTEEIEEPIKEESPEEPIETVEEEIDEESSTQEAVPETKEEFLQKMVNLYEEALKARGLSTAFAKRLAVQDILETGRQGQHVIGTFNYGNITVPESRADELSYTEDGDKDAQGNPITQKFRNFDSVEDYVNTKVDLLNGSRYRAFNGDEEGFYDRVKNGGYAESPTYVQSLEKLYKNIYGARNGMKLPDFKKHFSFSTPRGLKIK